MDLRSYHPEVLETRKEREAALNTSQTRAAKSKAQAEYTAAHRKVKRSIRKDKRDYIDHLASQAEEAASQGNFKDLYLITKKLAGRLQEGQRRKTTDDSRGTAEAMDRTLQRAAEPPCS